MLLTERLRFEFYLRSKQVTSDSAQFKSLTLVDSSAGLIGIGVSAGVFGFTTNESIARRFASMRVCE
jgi:hypothetical protein